MMNEIADFDLLRGSVDQCMHDFPDARFHLLFRHSIRGPIPKDPRRRDVPITASGVELAQELGRRSSQWFAQEQPALLSSPMLRCRQSAASFCQGAVIDPTLISSPYLGDPGPWISDRALAWEAYLKYGKHALVATLSRNDALMPGFCPLDEGIERLFAFLCDDEGARAPTRVTLVFSHDIIMTLLLVYLGGDAYLERWPGFHEGILLVQEKKRVHVFYRGEELTYRAMT